MPLDLDYRPRRFADVIGNDGIKRLLLARSRDGSISSQSMMFGGPKGCGKTTLARIVARAIKCSDVKGGDPCGACDPCVSILDETNPDVEELDAASQGTVDRVKGMISDADYGTFDGTDRRVYIVDEAQRLSKAAQDAFLKAIESRLFVAILCTTEPHKIVGPIRDRVEEYPVRAPSPDELVDRLVSVCADESISASREVLMSVARMCGFTPRSSLLAVESLSKLGPIIPETIGEYYRLRSYEMVDKMLSCVDSDPSAAMAAMDYLSSRESPTWIRDAIVQAVAGGLREEIGSTSRFPVPVHFWHSRGRGWLLVSRELSSVDRPSLADIEVAVLCESPIVPTRIPSCGDAVLPSGDQPRTQSVLPPGWREGLTPAPPPPVPTAAPASPSRPPILSPKKDPPPQPSPAVEHDGVVFRKSEVLTSLDDKIIKAASTPSPVRDSVRVESDKSRAPISESEFSSTLKSRIRRT